MANDLDETPSSQIVWDARDIERLRQQIVVIDEFLVGIRNGDFESLDDLRRRLEYDDKHFRGVLRRTVDRLSFVIDTDVERWLASMDDELGQPSQCKD